jgi:uncharacterized protein YjbI with pentapeptide repeats
MATETPTYRSMTQEELQAVLAADRSFKDVRFPAELSLDELDVAESRFERCHFHGTALRGTDFSNGTFEDCRFEPMRAANCKLVRAKLQGCAFFDAGTRKGCTFAFCDLQGAEIAKCNLATGAFERCDLYGLAAVDSSFRGAHFRQSSFTKTLSRRSALTKGSFERCNLSFADLSGLFRSVASSGRASFRKRHSSIPTSARRRYGHASLIASSGTGRSSARPTCGAPSCPASTWRWLPTMPVS